MPTVRFAGDAEYSRRYCRDCVRMVSANRPVFKWLAHLLATICTAGLWLPIWIMGYLMHRGTPWVCPLCDSFTDDRAPRRDEPEEEAPSPSAPVPIRFECQSCEKVIYVSGRSAGREICCPGCDRVVRVPRLG